MLAPRSREEEHGVPGLLRSTKHSSNAATVAIAGSRSRAEHPARCRQRGGLALPQTSDSSGPRGSRGTERCQNLQRTRLAPDLATYESDRPLRSPLTLQPCQVKRRTPFRGGVIPSALRWAPLATRRAVRQETPVARMWLRLMPSYRVPGYGLTTGRQDRVDACAVSAAPRTTRAHTTLATAILLLSATDCMLLITGSFLPMRLPTQPRSRPGQAIRLRALVYSGAWPPSSAGGYRS